MHIGRSHEMMSLIHAEKGALKEKSCKLPEVILDRFQSDSRPLV